MAVVICTRNVLDVVISFANGPSHTEVIIIPDDPYCVEVTCRAYGLSGMWIPIAGEALTGGGLMYFLILYPTC